MQRILVIGPLEDYVRKLHAIAASRQLAWELLPVENTEQAEEILSAEPVDAVISESSSQFDGGLEALNRIERKYPTIARILLLERATGRSGEAVATALNGSHNIVALDEPADEVVSVLSRSWRLTEILKSNEIAQLASQLEMWPSFPSTYAELGERLGSETATIAQIAAVIRRDPLLMARVLKVANSSFFGFRSKISDVERAVQLLGIEQMRHLVLANEVFSKFLASSDLEEPIAELWSHSLEVAAIASTIARDLGLAAVHCEESFSAGMLHDIGRLALMINLPDEYQAVLAIAKQGEMPMHDAERMMFGATHAEIGAFLLSLWNLSDSIVEAVAFHHSLLACCEHGLGTAIAVYLANVLERRRCTAEELAEQEPFVAEFLRRAGLTDRWESWREACEQRVLAEAQHGI